MPQSVWTYFLPAMREMVVSCTPTSPAMSLRVSGARYFGPRAKKGRWNSTIDLTTLSRVLFRCCMLWMNHLALRMLSLTKTSVTLSCFSAESRSKNGLMPTTGISSSLMMMTNSPSLSLTCTSGVT